MSSPTRLVVPKFAAHLAHLLNTAEGDRVHVRSFELERTLRHTLAGANGQPRAAHAYRDTLLGYAVVANGATADEVADRYIREVLCRPLFLARANHTHKGHELFHAMCKRGAEDGWSEVTLARDGATGAMEGRDGGGHTGCVPSDFAGVAERLARLDKSVSRGNPAATTRQEFGALDLRAGDERAEVAEELSVWAACTCGPQRLVRITAKSEWDSFCSLVIKALETAHDAYGRILLLGISPFEWSDTVSINRARACFAFLKRARRGRDGTDERVADTLDGWREAWAERSVGGFADADAFWNSDLGRALRGPSAPRQVDVDVADLVGDGEEAGIMPEAQLQGEEDYAEALDACEAAGVISPFERWFVLEVRRGATLEELEKLPEVQCALGGLDITDFATELTERILAWVQRRNEGDSGVDMALTQPTRSASGTTKELGQS